MQDKIIDSIKHGVDYLVTQQQKDGSFLSLSSPNPDNFDKALKFHSTFSTALILSCLNKLEETTQIKLIKHKCASFLLNQKSKHWSFNYCVRDSREAKQMPYPDDLDDTFCALSALFEFDPTLLDGTALATVVSLLTATESRVGGPYRTWLVPETADKVWKDIDLAVNSNIAYFLSLQDINLPNLNKFIASKISQAKIASPYYPTLYPIIYFISRFCGHKQKYSKALIKILLTIQNEGIWENSLYTALATLSLLSLGTPFKKLTPAINDLLSQQNPKGYWSPFAFCLDPASNGKSYYSGSTALTTAFCLEALQKYISLSTQKPIDNLQDSEAQLLYQQIIKNIKRRYLSLDSQLKAETLKSLETTLQEKNKKQVALLPFHFKLSLADKGRKVSDGLIIKLGMANIYGWIAYTIYDDFLDNEGEIEKLSVANFTLRELTIIFISILPDTKFNRFFHKVMDKMENANTWEVTCCRIKISNGKIQLKDFKIPNYGDFSKLAERSLGHALTPIAILYSLGFEESSKEVKNLLGFFKHYLIARQLNDDAHDWEKDLKMGHVNSVGALLLKKHHPKANINVSSLIPKLQEVFWYDVVTNVSNQVLEHTKMARKFLLQCGVSDQSLADQLLEKYEKGARLALKEQNNTIKFLASYQIK